MITPALMDLITEAMELATLATDPEAEAIVEQTLEDCLARIRGTLVGVV
jgi:hypothetical protein